MKNQLKMDGRVSPEALYERRKLIVNLYRNGMKIMAITKAVGMSWNAVRKTIDLYEAEGMKALKPKKRGRPTGTARTLTPEQEKQVQRDIRDKRPEQMKMDFALWTREAVLVYIREHFGIKMPVRTVGEYLKRWGFTPQKPIKVAYEQKPEAVKKWLDEEYPAISARAKAEKAEIHWADETAVMNTDVRGRSYSPRGVTPTTCSVWGARQKFSMISSVNNQGKCYWMIINDVFNADRLIEFMESIVKDVPRKVFLIMDNLKVHHSKPVQKWLEEHKEKIEVFYLPSYSPELNPDERLNADLKHAITTSVPRRTRQGLLKKTQEHMAMVKSSPERVKTYFKDKHVAYATDSQ
jgi:transposase